jgi:hypothetical protein
VSREVIIRSKLHPDGKTYNLVDVAALDADGLEELVRVSRRVAGMIPRSRPTPIANLRLSKAMGDAVAVLLPELERAVLRRLPDDERVRVLTRWADLALEGVGAA